jgi:hypothetical protein
MTTNIRYWSYLIHFFLEWEMFQTNVVQKIKKHILFSVNIFENLNIYEKIWKNIVEGADHVIIWPYTLHIGYQRLQIHKHTSCVLIVAFSTATMVARTRLNITLHVHCQSVCYCLRETTRIMSIMNVYLLMNLYKSHHFIYGTPEKNDSNYSSLRLNIIIWLPSNYYKITISLRTAIFTLVSVGI